jgi:hypothetical protein
MENASNSPISGEFEATGFGATEFEAIMAITILAI